MESQVKQFDQPYVKRSDDSVRKKILIIIPAYNESENIKSIIEEVVLLHTSLDILVDILVVNDGSTDNTSVKVDEKLAKLINLPFNLGIGGAVQTGFKFAKNNDYDIAIQLDGDGQHDPHYIEKIVHPVLNDKVDMLIGSRFLPPYLGYRSSLIRRIGIHFFAELISFLTKTKVTDPTSGFRCFNKKMIQIFARYYPQDFPEPEAIVVAKRYQARIREISVKMRKRNVGHSSIRYLKTLYYMIKVTFAIILDKVKRKGAQNS